MRPDEYKEIFDKFEENCKAAKMVGEEIRWPSGGSHLHDESNPLGIHSHFDDEAADGAHTHTPQNPGGEHAHGENKGMALIDGRHYHDDIWGDGYHSHDAHLENNSGQIPISEPGQTLPKTNPDQPSSE